MIVFRDNFDGSPIFSLDAPGDTFKEGEVFKLAIHTHLPDGSIADDFESSRSFQVDYVGPDIGNDENTEVFFSPVV